MAREKVLCGKEEIIRVAVGIVDKEGMEAVSVRRIAKELGVSSMTIYNYVENLSSSGMKVLPYSTSGTPPRLSAISSPAL